MTDAEHAAELEAFARQVEQLRGVSHRRPHAFAEDKSELVGRMRRRAVELRTVARTPCRTAPTGAIRPGTVVVGDRSIPVVVRPARRA